MRQRFIVAEISKNWPEAAMEEAFWGAHPDAIRAPNGMRRLLAERFEDVISTNHERGYALKDWKYSRVVTGTPLNPEYNETIIAVFELREVPEEGQR